MRHIRLSVESDIDNRIGILVMCTNGDAIVLSFRAADGDRLHRPHIVPFVNGDKIAVDNARST